MEFEPKPNNRWIVRFPDEFNIHSFTIKSIKRPDLTSYISERNNHMHWSDLKIIFHDLMDFNVTKILEDKSKEFFEITLDYLDAVGSVVESLKFMCYLKGYETSELDYASENKSYSLIHTTFGVSHLIDHT
jgi:hypothetical protein